MVSVGLLGMVGLLQYGAIEDVVCHPSATQPVRRGSVGKGSLRASCDLHSACMQLAVLPPATARRSSRDQQAVHPSRYSYCGKYAINCPSDTALGPLTLWRRFLGR